MTPENDIPPLTIIDEAQPVDPKIWEWLERAEKDPDNHPLLNQK